MANGTDPPQLSEREHQVLQMVATGASNQQIARQLVISINTVKVHLRNIYEKLEVQSRTEAVMYAAREGWVAVSEDGAAASETAAKTFLIADRQPALRQWQQLYLAFAMLLAVATVITPLILKNIPQSTIYLPPPIDKEGNADIFPQQPPTPTPVVSNGSTSNRWTFKAPLPGHRGGLGAVTFEGKLFAIGGVRTINKATRDVDIYNPDTDTWGEGTDKSTATTYVSGAVLNDRIYVPGGCTSEGQATNVLEIYDPGTDTWEQGQPLPEARCGYGLVGFENRLYLFGGWNGQAFVDTVFVYSVEKDEWKVIESKMPEAKGFVGATVLDDTIYVVGGYDGKNEFNQTYVFEPKTGEWQNKAPLNEPRGGFGLISAAGQLYAVGGGWKQPTISSEKYDPTTNTWTPFEAPFTDQWRNAGLAAIGTTLYVIGGWNDTEGKYMDSVVSYQVLYQLFLPISTFGE